MDLASAINTKQCYRFTGPPEHWLTAVKNMTWGLEMHHLEKWKRIQTGDIFFIHSTGAQSSVFSNASSGIIGIGVVGFHFSKKEGPLWHYEIKNQENRWPLLIPLAELYLFSELPDPSTWDAPIPTNDAQTAGLVDKLVSGRIPISSIKGFPQMGSFSSVSREVAEQILFQQRPLYFYTGHSKRGVVENKPSDFIKVSSATETLRHAASLRFIESLNQRIIEKPYSIVKRDNNVLARAESAHFTIVQQLIDIFRDKGYTTLSNEFVDLFAHNENRSYLFEVKSTENNNFRPQARKGIVQLFEYDYFDVRKYKAENDVDFIDEYKILVPSREPADRGYVDFINSLNLGVATVQNDQIRAIGRDFGFSSL